jgi:putative ABC transport system permease protein
VTAVAMSVGLPAANPTQPREFQIAGEGSTDGVARYASFRTVTSAYFDTLSIPLLHGRTCRMNTAPEQPFEAIVNRAFADRFFRGRDPIGRTIIQGTGAGLPIVGVAADIKEDGPGVDAPPVIYACGYLRFWPDSDILVRHTHSAAIVPSVRAVEPSSPIYAARPLDDALSAALGQTRFRVFVVTLFSSLALALAAIGLYGVMAYAVSQRSREFGIRMALGAGQGRILAEVLRSGAVLALIGAIGGVALGAVGARAIGTLLYDVHPLDVVSYAGAVGALFVVAMLACLIPARRAVSIHPTDALRES